jgi:PAS domain S-box-containing protein
MPKKPISKQSETRIEALDKEALKASEEKYRRIVENLNTGILVAQDARLVYVNPGIANFLGYTEDALLSHPNPFEFIHPDDLEMVFERHMRRQQGETVPDVYPYRVITKEGQIKWVEVTGVQIAWDGKPATLNFFIDITEQKQAQMALQHSEERYRSLVENTMDGYFIFETPSGRFIFLNQRVCELFGYAMQQGLEITIWDVINPAEHEIARDRIKKFMERDINKIDTIIYNVIRKDGSTFRAEVSSSLVTYEGRPAVQGTVRDITEKEDLQNQLFQAQRLESIGTLAGGLAHDFNNLLMGIQGRISMMLMNTDPFHQDYEHLKGVGEFVKRAVHLTKQLLDFARGGKYEVQPINLNKLIDESAHLFGRTKKEIKIHTKFEKNLWTVEVDRRQIEQVLLNL